MRKSNGNVITDAHRGFGNVSHHQQQHQETLQHSQSQPIQHQYNHFTPQHMHRNQMQTVPTSSSSPNRANAQSNGGDNVIMNLFKRAADRQSNGASNTTAPSASSQTKPLHIHSSGGSSTGPGQDNTATNAQIKSAIMSQLGRVPPAPAAGTEDHLPLLSPHFFVKDANGGDRSSTSSSSVPGGGASSGNQALVLSRMDFKSKLLHLIQTDVSFLDDIYSAYCSECMNRSS